MLTCEGTSTGAMEMMSFLKFSAIAASRGEGLHPQLRDLLERAATHVNSEVVRHDGMLRAGPPPASENSQPLDDVILLLPPGGLIQQRTRRP